MYKKTLLSLAVASTLTLTGCLDDGDNFRNAAPEYNITTSTDGKVYPVFNPVTSELPIPNDLIFDSEQGDGTFGVTPDPTNPAITALNELSGASTIAPIDIKMSGLIKASSVDGNSFVLADPNDPTSIIPNPNQNVFLIETEYASGDPVQGLAAQEPPTIPQALVVGVASGALPDGTGGLSQAAAAGMVGDLFANPVYDAQAIELSGTSYIRINPLKPLNPRKRYVVIVTDEVLDTQDQSIVPSSSYANLTDENTPLGTSSLAPVRALINGLWEKLGVSYFAISNAARPADSQLTDENIALSFSLTTSNDEKVLQYIAEPSAWFFDQLTTFIRVKAAKAVVEGELDLNSDGNVDYSDVKIAADTAILQFPSAEIQAALPFFAVDPASGGCKDLTGDEALECTGLFLSNVPVASGGFADLLPTPAAKTVNASLTTAEDSLQVTSIVSSLGLTPGDVAIVQGDITLPYYQGVPVSNADGSAIKTDSWIADPTLAGGLNTAFSALGLEIPQADPNVSTALNYIFPFPKKVSDEKVPMLVMFNTATLNAATPVVIYQHGITTDRSTALTFGSSLIKALGGNVAVVAIDQPLHGVAPFSLADQEELATTLLTIGQGAGLPAELAPSQSTVDALIAKTLTIGFVGASIGKDPSVPADLAVINGTIDTVIGGGTTGNAGLDAAIYAVRGFENTAEGAGSTVPGITTSADGERHFNFTADAASNPIPMDFDKDSAVGSSGSLFINLTSFLTSRDNMRQMSTDLLNLRASISAIDMDGNSTPDFSGPVYFIGHSLGTIDGAPFIAAANENQTVYQHPVFNPGGLGIAANDITGANLLTPGGGIVRLLENSPTFSPSILEGLAGAAGLVQGDADLESYFNVLQATLDSVDPTNSADNLAASSKVLLSMVIGDQVIPNSAYPAGLGMAQPAPLAGTEPLATSIGAESVTTSIDLSADTAGITRYTAGSHSTPVLPATGDAEAALVYAEMISQAAQLIATGAAGTINVADTSIVEQ